MRRAGEAGQIGENLIPHRGAVGELENDRRKDRRGAEAEVVRERIQQVRHERHDHLGCAAAVGYL